VIKPDESVLTAHNDALGSYLTDTSGKTLYYFAKDTPGQSACTGSCIGVWPPFSADAVTAPSLLNPTAFSTVSRADGMKQTAFMGRPLYFYSGDTKPGNVNGEGFNNQWYAAGTSGNLPVVTIPPTPVPTTVPHTFNPPSAYGGGSY
jgi:predicted lipoprotein with Yx(FWY)xxD motif